MLYFQWDEEKAERNEVKHGVSFEEAASVFGDPLSLTISDDDHPLSEERFVALGRSSSNRLLVVVHLELEGDILLLISARGATRKERESYEKG